MSHELPSALLRASEVVVAEASTGIKANLQRFWAGIPAARVDRNPAERARLYGLLGWLHAVIQERRRYLPLGWSKQYEFNDSDAACALDVVDQWLDEVAANRAHVAPEDLPWQALRTLLSQSIYGGRVDHPFDQAALDSFINSVLSPRSYEASAVLVSDAQGKAVATLPDGLGRAAFEAWIRELPDSNSPAWLGLPVTAEAALQSSTGHRALHKLAVLQGVAGDEDESGAVDSSSPTRPMDGASANPASSSPGSGAALQRGLLTAAERWLALLPAASTFAGATDSSALVARSSDSGASAVERALARELLHASSALALVSADARALQQYGTGAAKATNAVRELAAAVARGTPPAAWAALFTAAPDQAASVEAWVADFAARLAALKTLAPLLNRPAGAAASRRNRSRSAGSSASPPISRTTSPRGCRNRRRRRTASASPASAQGAPRSRLPTTSCRSAIR
jgi:dynein heavy chain 1